ncbi:tetratricopeptide repeat protein [Flavilitoribacter nigricans]|nr:hypothetical protein [Flavilitoribacter nigricans]
MIQTIERAGRNALFSSVERFALTAEDQSGLGKMLNEQGRKAVFQQAEQWNKETKRVRNKLRFGTKQIQLAAATFLLIIVSVFLIRMLIKNSGPEQLVAEFFSPFPGIGLVKAGNNGDNAKDSLRSLAAQYYSAEDWENAILQYNALNDGTPDSLSLFFLGNSYLATGDYELAGRSLELFRPMAAVYNLSDPSNWYLALAYLGQQDVEKASKLLDELAQKQTAYGRLAGQLIVEIAADRPALE